MDKIGGCAHFYNRVSKDQTAERESLNINEEETEQEDYGLGNIDENYIKTKT